VTTGIANARDCVLKRSRSASRCSPRQMLAACQHLCGCEARPENGCVQSPRPLKATIEARGVRVTLPARHDPKKLA
jgi:hypothetical protein